MVVGSNPIFGSVLVAYSVNVSDCGSEEQGSIPANTPIGFVAQLDRALHYGCKGSGFDSL